MLGIPHYFDETVNYQYSFALACYQNDDPFELSECLESLLAQTLPPFDISICIDGPIPIPLYFTLTEFRSQAKKLGIIFTITKLSVNQGRSFARNTAIANTMSSIVALMDADDICYNTRAEKQISYLNKHKNIKLVGSWGLEVSGHNENANVKKCPEKHHQIAKSLRLQCPIVNPSIMFYKSFFFEVGGYPNFKYTSEDHALFLWYIKKNIEVACIQEPLLIIRASPIMLKRRVGLKPLKSDLAFRIYALNNNLIGPISFIIGCIASFLRRLLPVSLSYSLTKFARTVYSES